MDNQVDAAAVFLPFLIVTEINPLPCLNRIYFPLLGVNRASHLNIGVSVQSSSFNVIFDVLQLLRPPSVGL